MFPVKWGKGGREMTSASSSGTSRLQAVQWAGIRKTFVALLTLLAVTVFYIAFFAPQAHAIEETPDQGTWHVTGGRVEASVLSEDGKTLYIGGSFNKVWEKAPGTGGDSFAANGLAAIDVESGTALRSWRPGVSGADGHVMALEVKGNSVFVGGSFTAVNGQPRQYLAEVDATNGSLKPFAPSIRSGNATLALRALKASNDKLYIGGAFDLVNGQGRGNLAAFNLSNRTLDPQWKPRARGVVRALEMATDGETVFATGTFDIAKGSTDADFSERKVVARFDSISGELDPWFVPKNLLRGDVQQSGWVLLATPTRLYGGFGDTGENYVKSLRLDNGDTGSQAWSFNTVGDPYGLALSEDGSRLFAGGHFGTNRLHQSVCGKRMYALISLNPQTGKPYCDWIPRMELYNKDQRNGHTVHTIRSVGNYVYVGGSFYSVTDVEQRNLARFSIVPPPEVIPPPQPIGEVKVNFQTGDAPVPAGYVKDFGEKFGSKVGADQGQGLYYGWVQPGTDNRISLTDDGRDRNTEPDQRLDTFMHMQKSAEGAWEMSVPNGKYQVTLSAGDAGYIDSVFNINVEGQNVINHVTPTNDNKFASGTATVQVTDERLTVDPLGGQNTKINYIDVKSLDAKLAANTQDLDFGNKGLGFTPKTTQFTLKNTGTSDVSVQGIAIQGPDAKDFKAALSGGNTIAAGQEATVDVEFLPQEIGTKTATLVVNHSGDNPAISVGLTGKGVPNGAGCTIIGTNGDDVITGTAGDDVICGYGGADVIYGLGGNDEIHGHSGPDKIYGGAGNDRLYGEGGPDELYGEEGDDLLVGGPNTDLLNGGPGNNTLQQ